MDGERKMTWNVRDAGARLTTVALVSALLCVGAAIDVATNYAGPHLGFGVVVIAAWALHWHAIFHVAPGLAILATFGTTPARIVYLCTALAVGVVIFRFIAGSGMWRDRSPKGLALGAAIVSGYSAGLAVIVPPFSRYASPFAESWLKTGLAEFAGFGACFAVIYLTFRGVF